MATSGNGLSPGVGGAIATGLGALGGFFPDNTKQKTQTTSANVATGSQASNTATQFQNYLNTLSNIFGSSNLTGSQAGKTTTTPNLSPEMQAYINNLMGRSQALTAPSLTGYTANQTQNINQNADLQKQAVNNIMASRGLSTSPVAATAQSGVEQNRINNITQMQEQVPLLQNQLNLQNMAQASQIANMLPGLAGSTATTEQQQQQAQTQQQQQTGSQSQQQYGQTWQNLFNFMQQFGNQWGTQDTSQGGGVGGALSGAASAFAAVLPFLMASDKDLKKDIKHISQDKAIEKVRELNGRAWKWKGGDRSDSGFIAQEVERILPDAVDMINIKGTDVKAINYAAILPYIVGAIQNLDARIGE